MHVYPRSPPPVLQNADTSFDDPLSYTILEGTALNSFLYKALLDAAYVGTVLGNTAAAANYTAAANALGVAVNANLWNATEGTYNSGINTSATGTEVVFGPTVHAAMLALQRGVVPPARVASTVSWFLSTFQRIGGFHCCTNPDYEVRGPWLALHDAIPRTHTTTLCVAQAMIAERAGLNMTVVYYWAWQVIYGIDTPAADALALSEMRRRESLNLRCKCRDFSLLTALSPAEWGNMLLATDIDTLWEAFDDSESCHNYGAVPAYFLSAYVLGVRISGPSWEPGALRIEPRLGGLPAASGAVVTELGVVLVSWSLDSTSLSFSLVLPAGVGSLVPLRLAETNGTSLVLNGLATPTVPDGRYSVVMLPGPGSYWGSIGVSPAPVAVALPVAMPPLAAMPARE